MKNKNFQKQGVQLFFQNLILPWKKRVPSQLFFSSWCPRWGASMVQKFFYFRRHFFWESGQTLKTLKRSWTPCFWFFSNSVWFFEIYMKNRNFLVFNTNVLSRLMSELFKLEKPEKSAIFQLLWPPPWKKCLIRAIFDLRKKNFSWKFVQITH